MANEVRTTLSVTTCIAFVELTRNCFIPSIYVCFFSIFSCFFLIPLNHPTNTSSFTPSFKGLYLTKNAFLALKSLLSLITAGAPFIYALQLQHALFSLTNYVLFQTSSGVNRVYPLPWLKKLFFCAIYFFCNVFSLSLSLSLSLSVDRSIIYPFIATRASSRFHNKFLHVPLPFVAWVMHSSAQHHYGNPCTPWNIHHPWCRPNAFFGR